MARLIPEVTGRRLASEAEKELADRFRADLDNDAVLLHSVGLVRHAEKRWAEADFVLICPDGIFCLEVKGGRVRRTGGEWFFTDRHGHVNTKYEGPFDQAGGAAAALQAWLSDHGIRRNDGSRYQVGYGVMLPHCVLDEEGPDIDQQLLYDGRHVDAGLRKFVERLGVQWLERRGSGAGPMSTDDVERLTQAIRPDFEATLTRGLVVGAVEDRLIRFTEEQTRLLDGLVDNPRVLVRGAAGAGKSLIAVREATRLASEGSRVLLVCHSRALSDTLAAAARHDLITVGSFGSYAMGIIGARRNELPDATDDVLFERFVPQLAVDVLDRDGEPPCFDALVVDEAQDLLRGDAVLLLDRLLVGGLTSGCWRAFLDPNQNVFGQVQPDALARLEEGNPARYRLTRNCRNTLQVVQYAGILSGATGMAESQTSGPEVVLSDGWAVPWADRVLHAVDEIASGGTAAADTAVLVPMREDRDRLLAVGDGRFADRRIPGRVLVSTVAGFKGLEATAVVLAGLRSLDDQRGRQAAYIGATRAKVLLHVVLPDVAEASYRRRIEEYAAEIAAQIRAADRRT